MKYKNLYILAALLFFLSALKFYPKDNEKILKVKKDDFQEKIIISGVVKSPEIINISSEISGRVINIPKKEGDYVKKGETLIEVDNSQLFLKLLQEEEKLKSAISQLNKLQTTDFHIANSNLKTSELNFKISENEYSKFKKLFDKNLSTELEFNSKKLKYLADKNNYLEFKKKLESITTGEDKQSLLINIENIKLSIRNIHEELKKYVITSPTEGIITEKNIETGEILPQYTTVLEISSGNNKIFEIDLDEKQISKISLNQKIEVFFPNDTTFKATGKIFYIAPFVNKNNGTIKIKGTLDNPPSQFLYNMNINGIIYGKEYKNVVTIPEEFLYLKDNTTFVYKKNGKNTQLTKVETILNYSQNVIIKEGVSSGDTIVLPANKINEKVGFTHYE